MGLQNKIAKMLKEINELPSDWQAMTLRDIFTELDRVLGNVVFWGLWTKQELDTVFNG